MKTQPLEMLRNTITPYWNNNNIIGNTKQYYRILLKYEQNHRNYQKHTITYYINDKRTIETITNTIKQYVYNKETVRYIEKYYNILLKYDWNDFKTIKTITTYENIETNIYVLLYRLTSSNNSRRSWDDMKGFIIWACLCEAIPWVHELIRFAIQHRGRFTVQATIPKSPGLLANLLACGPLVVDKENVWFAKHLASEHWQLHLAQKCLFKTYFDW